MEAGAITEWDPDVNLPLMYNFASKNDRHQGASLHHLLACVRQGIITKEEIKHIVMEAYYPHISWFDYTLSNISKGLAIITHAPLQIADIIQHAYDQFGIFMNTSPAKDFFDGLKEINNTLYNVLSQFMFTDHVPSSYPSRQHNSTYVSLWTRNISADAPPSTFKRETSHEDLGDVGFIHGHNLDPRGSAPRKGIYCLDDVVGKTIESHRGGIKITALVNSLRPEIRATAESVLSAPEPSLSIFGQKDKDDSSKPGRSSSPGLK